MSCIDLPKVPVPSLPGGLSLGLPTVSTPPLTVPFCCTINIPSAQLFSTAPIPLPIGAVLLPVVMLLTSAVGQINSFLDSLTPDCPLNSSPRVPPS